MNICFIDKKKLLLVEPTPDKPSPASQDGHEQHNSTECVSPNTTQHNT